MNIIAIDPGPVQSAFVIYEPATQRIIGKGILPNEDILKNLGTTWREGYCLDGELVIEQMASMGMAVGAEVFETVFWSGRFAQEWKLPFHRMKRHEIKMHLCGSMQAKDGNIAQALRDRIGPKGKKKTPGPTFGMAGDMWQALAVAVTWGDKYGERKVKELFQQQAA